MTLIKCPECKKEISNKAGACTHCGYTLKNNPPYRRWNWGYEYKSKAQIMGWPLVHITLGRNIKTGKLYCSKGIIAIGQFAMGLITIAQFGIGYLFGLGQFILGYTVISQFAIGVYIIAQFGFGYYVLATFGYGRYVWSMYFKDPEAVSFFNSIFKFFNSIIRK